MSQILEQATASIAGRNVEAIDVPIIQPAEPFLDMAGENLRRRIFLTESETGQILCLRPEFTIPVCIKHIENRADTPFRYSYSGLVFRQHPNGPREFYQAGIEDLGDRNIARADARSLGDAIHILSQLLPAQNFHVALGDQSLFEAVLFALKLPASWVKRLVRTFGLPAQMKVLLHQLSQLEDSQNTGYQGADSGARAHDIAALAHDIEQQMMREGLSPNAGRSPVEIAERMFEKKQMADACVPAGVAQILAQFLALELDLITAENALQSFSQKHDFNIDDALKLFSKRVSEMANLGLDLSMIKYNAGFGRSLDYYSALVFEIYPAGQEDVLVAGGRYDHLLTLLGAKEPIPGIGFSLWIERIERQLAGAA